MKRSDWCVIGNGPASSHQLPLRRVTIGFNQVGVQPAFDVMLHNNKSIGLTKTLTVSGSVGFRAFSPRLKQIAQQLEKQLGVWPSLGLVVAKLGAELGFQLSMRQMNLLPSLARSFHLSSTKPLPASYHNWLAERRLILSLAHDFDWPEFSLIHASKKPSILAHQRNDYLAILLSLPTLDNDSAEQAITLLSRVNISGWLTALKIASYSDIKACDTLFILSRESTKTRNWWLYDHLNSVKMDRIRFHLAQAQELLFSRLN